MTRLEICIDNLESLFTAERSGADRIELCSALGLGGLTPSYGFMQLAARHASVPVYAMIRPRAGDFCFSAAEFELMLLDIAAARAAGLQGVVVGLLDEGGRVPAAQLQQLVEAAGPLGVTFHRAIDLSSNWRADLETIVAAGCERILSSGQAPTALAGLETLQAMQTGFSSNLVVHAFAHTARACGIDEAVVRPFFASMRMDISTIQDGELSLDSAEHELYVYGSAQVVGLMCVRVFSRYGMSRRPNAATAALLDDAGKALGSAFQNVNFLRDLADDADRLQRSYLADGATRLDEGAKLDWVARIREDLAVAEVGINLLPRDCRAGVRVAHALFAELNDRVEVTPVDELYRERVSVPSAVKARLIASSVLKEDPWRRPWSSVRA